MLFKNGFVYTMEDEPQILDFRIEQGKFTQVGQLEPALMEEVIDCTGMQVFPGMVEAHCHLGLEAAAIGFEGNDCNEMADSDPATPQLRGIDSINVLDETVVQARDAGITTVCSGPGSANVVGGTFTAWKTAGNCIDEMAILEPAAMKAAFGENPKRIYKDRSIMTRMGIAAVLRKVLDETAEYKARKEYALNRDPLKTPPYNAKYEAMIPVIEKKIPLKCHAHQHNDIATVLRIAKEYNLDVTLDHCTDGELIIEQIKDSGFPAIIGPTLGHKRKVELVNKSFKTPAAFSKAGILFSITTDSPVIPQQYLPLCAALAVREGLDAMEALKAITINPAKILKLDHRIGSIAPGKDADFIICDGFLLDPFNQIQEVFIDGKPVLNPIKD